MSNATTTTSLFASSPIRNRYSMNQPRTYDSMAPSSTRAADEQRILASPYKTVLFNTFSTPMKVYFECREEIKIDNTIRRFH